MSDAFPNSITDGVPFSADLVPDGPDVNDTDDPSSGMLSHDNAGSLYADLPDIAVPKHRTS